MTVPSFIIIGYVTDFREGSSHKNAHPLNRVKINHKMEQQKVAEIEILGQKLIKDPDKHLKWSFLRKWLTVKSR